MPGSSSSDSGSVSVSRLIPRELTTVDTNYSKTDLNTLAAVGILQDPPGRIGAHQHTANLGAKPH